MYVRVASECYFCMSLSLHLYNPNFTRLQGLISDSSFSLPCHCTNIYPMTSKKMVASIICELFLALFVVKRVVVIL